MKLLARQLSIILLMDSTKECKDTEMTDAGNEAEVAQEVPTTEELKAEYPQYTEENPMKLPVETAEDFVIGLDFGNTTSVVAIAKYGELSHHPFVLHNTLGDLSHHALISFGDSRILGTDATSQLTLSPKETIFDIKYLNFHSKNDQDDAHYPFNLTEKENLYNGIQVNSTYLESGNLSFPQVIGALIGSFASYAESDMLYWQFREKILHQRIPKDVPVEKRSVTSKAIKQCVVAVPACYSPQQRASILDAGEIAGIDIVGLVDEGVASALTYTVSRRHQMKEQRKENPSADDGDNYPETVVVVDMGHSFFNLAIAKVGYNRVKILHSSSLDIGGNSFQNKLTDHITTMLKSKFNVSGDLSLRTRARLSRAIEKTMKVLSTVATSHVEVENFQDGVDVREVFSRAEFESLCADLLTQVSSHVSAALSDAGLTPSADLKVEVVGGGCRIPSVQAAIQRATGASQLGFTLDSNNAVATGASIYGALVHFKGTYDLEDKTFEYIPVSGEEKDLKPFRLSADDLEEAKKMEQNMRERDQELRRAQELRNSMEQFLYRFMDDLATFRSQIPDEEASAIEPTLETEKEWLLYSEESASCPVADLEARFNELQSSLTEKGPTLHKLLEQRQAEREKAEAEAAEAEANRKVTYRDKVKNPKTPKERVDAAMARKDQGNSFFK